MKNKTRKIRINGQEYEVKVTTATVSPLRRVEYFGATVQLQPDNGWEQLAVCPRRHAYLVDGVRVTAAEGKRAVRNILNGKTAGSITAARIPAAEWDARFRGGTTELGGVRNRRPLGRRRRS